MSTISTFVFGTIVVGVIIGVLTGDASGWAKRAARGVLRRAGDSLPPGERWRVEEWLGEAEQYAEMPLTMLVVCLRIAFHARPLARELLEPAPEHASERKRDQSEVSVASLLAGIQSALTDLEKHIEAGSKPGRGTMAYKALVTISLAMLAAAWVAGGPIGLAVVLGLSTLSAGIQAVRDRFR